MIKEINNKKREAFRASIFDFNQDPQFATDKEEAYRYFEDGLLVICDGKVESVSSFAEGCKRLDKNITITDYTGKLIIPGFIDTHIHYAQSQIIGSYGQKLLDWLTTYAFPAEGLFNDKDYCKKITNIFLEELYRNGTTTAMVFGTVHPQSVDALFESAEKYNMRLIAGKVMMDRNAPDFLLDTAQKSYDESNALIEKWHDRGRCHYAITPRFAPTSTEAQLEAAQALISKHPTTYMQTHLSENEDEVAWVKDLFPNHKNYLDVYDHYDLITPNSVFAHCIYLSDYEYKVMHDRGASISFCPSSNLFLGSGLFDIDQARKYQVNTSLATDVGGGTSFSMIKTLLEAYKVSLVKGCKIDILDCLYMVTLGNARCLHLDDKIGNFDKNKEADFIVLNLEATPLQKFRSATTKTLEEKLFSFLVLGDDRNIEATYIMGKKVF